MAGYGNQAGKWSTAFPSLGAINLPVRGRLLQERVNQMRTSAARSGSTLLLTAACLTALTFDCGGSGNAPGAGNSDAGGLDAGGMDAGNFDAGNSDAGNSDGGGLKAPMVGLIDMGRVDFGPRHGAPAPVNNPGEISPYARSFTGIVINLTWADLEPSQGAPINSGNPLDQILAAVRNYNSSNSPYSLNVKIRISGGFAAPDWAKNLDGAPIAISYTKQNGQVVSDTLGRYWTATYIAANTDEPFVPLLDQATVAALHGAGYSDAAQRSCLAGALADYASWKNTQIDFTFNVFSQTDTVPTTQDPGFTTQVMTTCTVAAHCILSTHYLNDPLGAKGNQNPFIYAQMQNQAADAVTDFQTQSPALLDWCGAIREATLYRGLSVELWPVFGGFTTLPAAQVENLA